MEYSKNQKPRLFFDMDGVLAEWREAATIEDLYQKGYFLSLLPQKEVIKAAEKFQKEGHEVFVLSAVFPDAEFAESDKNEWLDKYMPFVDAIHRIFCQTGTCKTKAIPGGIRESDILLDDYSLNLIQWGTKAKCVKILNGVNHLRGNWQGLCADAFDVEAIAYAVRIAEEVSPIRQAFIRDFVMYTELKRNGWATAWCGEGTICMLAPGQRSLQCQGE